MRLSPETTEALPSTYLRLSVMTGCTPCSSLPSLNEAMKPSSTRIRAISRFTRDAGTTTSRWCARDALRMRVSMSAIGSERFIVGSPARLRHARDLAREGALPEADAAEREPAHIGAGPATQRAPVVPLHLVLGCSLRLGNQRLLGHGPPPRASRRRACRGAPEVSGTPRPVSYTHLRAHET